MANEQRYYPHVGDLDEAREAIKQLHDHVYTLREQMDAGRKEHELTKQRLGVANEAIQKLGQGINSQIVGLNVSGSPTANGQKLTWNAATGQLEWQ